MSGEECWHINLLGGVSLERSGQLTTHFRTKNISALLVWLALKTTKQYSQPQSRETLAAMLWPEHEKPQSVFRYTLSQLRRVLELPNDKDGTFLIATSETVRLNPKRVIID